VDIPAVGAVALADVLGEGDCRIALDRDPVVVPDDDEISQLLRASERGGLRGDAFLKITVGGDDVDPMIEGTLALGGVRIQESAFVAR
jgi:hypothetical protein